LEGTRGRRGRGEAVSAWRSCNVRSLPATVSAREGPAAAVQRQAGSVSLISRIGTGDLSLSLSLSHGGSLVTRESRPKFTWRPEFLGLADFAEMEKCLRVYHRLVRTMVQRIGSGNVDTSVNVYQLIQGNRRIC
jgi:hypothetical protein